MSTCQEQHALEESIARLTELLPKFLSAVETIVEHESDLRDVHHAAHNLQKIRQIIQDAEENIALLRHCAERDLNTTAEVVEPPQPCAFIEARPIVKTIVQNIIPTPTNESCKIEDTSCREAAKPVQRMHETKDKLPNMLLGANNFDTVLVQHHSMSYLILVFVLICTSFVLFL